MITNSDQARGLRQRRSNAPRISRHSIDPNGPKVIAVTSGKGGVGKTQVAANLGVSLAQQGKRVILLDADLGLASLDLALGLKPEFNLLHVLNGERDPREALTAGPEGVQLLPACPGRYEMANLNKSGLTKLWGTVRSATVDADVVVIDTGAGIGSTAVGFAAFADEIVLVVTPDPTSLRDAYAMLKVLHRRAGVDRAQVLANQVESDRDGHQIHQRLVEVAARFLEMQVDYLGSVPRDDAVRAATLSGAPFVVQAPSSDGARAITEVARRLSPPDRTEVSLC